MLIDGPPVPRWVARVVDQIASTPFAELAGCVRLAEERRPSGTIKGVWAARSSLLYGLYERLEARHFSAAPDPLEKIDISDRLDRVPIIAMTRNEGTSGEPSFDPDAIRTVSGWGLDVILALGSGATARAIVDCARYGTWSYHYGDPHRDDGEPPLFWEIYDRAPLSASALHRLTDQPGAREVIYQSFSATDPISLHRTRTRVYGKSSAFVVRKLREVYRDGELGVLTRDERGTPSTNEIEIRGTPTNRQMVRFGGRLVARLGRQKASKAVARQQWFLAYQRRRTGLPTATAFRGATVLMPPRGRFFADPCLVDWQDSSHLFFEDFGFAEQKGVISCCQLTPDGGHTRPEIVLERPYHLSYPCVFFVGEDAYMLPETAASGAIELYKARSFPSGWALESVLVPDVRAVDPTLLEHDGRFWLFANVAAEGASTNDELFLFSARSLRGPWEEHPRNPIVSDVRRARPAGRLFVDESASLIRPSQDCSGFYGSAVVLNRIDELSQTGYRETPLHRLEPSWHDANLGTHTYTRSALWEAMDGRLWARRRA